jgi:hypothetical protein
VVAHRVITTEDVQRVKQHLAGKVPKTVNNVLTVLGTLRIYSASAPRRDSTGPSRRVRRLTR